MPRPRLAHPPEFRRQLLELVRAGRTPDELAQEFEPSAHAQQDQVVLRAIRTWHARSDATYRAPRFGDDLRDAGLCAHPAPLEAKVTTVNAKGIACGVALLALGSATPLHAQIDIGTWVRQPTASMPGAMTMKVEACCNGGRRLTYHFVIADTQMVLTVASPFDGSEVPVLIGGKPSGETMSIKKVDDHHASNDFSSSAGGQPVGKSTETWVRK